MQSKRIFSKKVAKNIISLSAKFEASAKEKESTKETKFGHLCATCPLVGCKVNSVNCPINIATGKSEKLQKQLDVQKAKRKGTYEEKKSFNTDLCKMFLSNKLI